MVEFTAKPFLTHFCPKKMLRTTLILQILLIIIAGQLSVIEATTRRPQRSRSRRVFWDKDDEHTNKTVPIQRRHVTTTGKTTALSNTMVFYDNPRAQPMAKRQTPYPVPPADWYVITTRRPQNNRDVERLLGKNYVVSNSQHSQNNGRRLAAPPSVVLKGGIEGANFNTRTGDDSNNNNNNNNYQPANGCAVPYRFGSKCDGVCHCSTLLACDKVTGQCKSGICAHGFMDPPSCQRPCPGGQFGFRCGFYCHCWKGAICDSVNGFCAPDGKCAEEWFGPSCQVRKLELSDSPFVTVSECENITVSWRQWSSELDFGNPEIVVKNYELEVRTPSRPQWRTIYRVLSDDETLRTASKKQPLVFNYTPAPDTRFYQFRVIVNGLDSNGKYVTGVPSIPTEVFQRNCPTEEGGGSFSEVITPFPGTTTSRYTLPPPITPYPTFPPISIGIVTTSSSMTTVTPSTTSTTTLSTTLSPSTTSASISVTDFQLTNDPNNPGTVQVSWKLATSTSSLPQDAGLLVEMIGIGDCDPFQTTEGPQIFKLSNSSVQLLRLERWRQYRITLLRSIAASDVASASLARKLIITTGDVPSAVVENMQLEDVSSRTARLSWSPLPCEHRGDKNITYEVNLYRTPRAAARSFDSGNSTKPPPYLTITTNRTWVTFTQLSPAYEYLVKVNAKNKYGAGRHGRLQFTTPSEELPRPAPQFLPPIDVRPDQVTLAWSISPASPGLVYPAIAFCELKITPADSIVPFLLEKYPNCSQTNRTVTGLRPNTRYLAELTQLTSEGQSSYQTMVIATPEAQPGAPVNLIYRLYNKTCSEIDWDPPNPPNGIIANYSLYLSILDSYMPLRRQSVERYIQKDPGRILCNLMLSTRYSFSAQAATSAGYGPMSEITFWTPIAQPDPPPVPFARLSDDDMNLVQDSATIVVLAQPLRFSTGVITAYYLKLATMQQLKEYETIYGVAMNGTSLYITPDTKSEAALAALPGRLVHRVLPDRFEQQQGGPLLHQAILEVPAGQMYRIVWAVSVQLEEDTRLAASVSEVVRVPAPAKTDTTAKPQPPTFAPPQTTLGVITTGSTYPLAPTLEKAIYNNTVVQSDERVGWVFGIVIALIILLVIIAILIILFCCCWKRFDVPVEIEKQPPVVQKWSSSEHVQTEEPPLSLEDWFNPTTQVDDSRYVVRGQRVLTPTRYSATIITPRV